MLKEDAEIERERRLVQAIAEAMHAKIAELHPMTQEERLEHEDDHKFISELKEAHVQQKKLRSSIIEHVLKSGVLGAGLLIVLAIWNYFKFNVRM